MLITPLTAPSLIPDVGDSRPVNGSNSNAETSSSDVMRVLLGEVTRHIQKNSGLFTGSGLLSGSGQFSSKENGTASLFHNELAGALLAQCLAERLAEKLSGDPS
ncbi:hypothetical protein [Endozoicomonas sp. SCSIO W0465]|uniref:hypothetical protein n=1 Tax=Endozoicomonas sp. SCSIO W0465 TaxID=2918516 RepID=UPI0020753527|nr:hypothetical protein [Endozoicomonas sp. SCSIO W0465]USE38271.1 hypothetical protein MJO57_08955 [Endozoicomonas sp. SCSIO W0465]